MRANLAGITLVIAAPALGILAGLRIAGSVPWPAFFAAALVSVATSLGLAWLWRRDLERLVAILERLGQSASMSRNAPRVTLLRPLFAALASLARRLGDREAWLAEEGAVAGVIFERLPDPCVVLDAGQHAIRANRAARALFGRDLPAVLRHPELRAAVLRARADGQPETAGIALSVPIERQVVAHVLALDAAAPGRSAIVLSDRTRERAVERMRADFVANASHELRTPLSSLIGFVETLRGPAKDDPAAQQKFLGIMAAEAARMQRLIEDLLSLSRIELDEHQPPSESVQLADLLPPLIAGFAPRLRERRIEASLELKETLQPVTADSDQLLQVLHNLVDNAVKYGRDGGRIRITAAPQDAGVAVSIADDGPGIARRHLPRLTERFYRVDKGRSRAAGGTGLGLAIVKHIVNRHRGRFTIESEEGAGTTCTVWLKAAGRDES